MTVTANDQLPSCIAGEKEGSAISATREVVSQQRSSNLQSSGTQRSGLEADEPNPIYVSPHAFEQSYA